MSNVSLYRSKFTCMVDFQERTQKQTDRIKASNKSHLLIQSIGIQIIRPILKCSEKNALNFKRAKDCKMIKKTKKNNFNNKFV